MKQNKNTGYTDILFGLLWGDEGKGKIVDTLTPDYNVVLRPNAGPNAGHSVEIEGKTYVAHHIPCGFAHEDKMLICGSGMAINPVSFLEELGDLEKVNPNLRKQLYVSHQATIITPIQVLKDCYREELAGKLGSTKKGISFTYADDALHIGLRIGDFAGLSARAMVVKYNEYRNTQIEILEKLYPDISTTELKNTEGKWMQQLEVLIQKISIVDTVKLANQLLSSGKNILIEGAQAALLDTRHGCYPYNTSSHTTPQMLLGYAGLPIHAVRDVIAVTKWYGTRVGGVNPPSTMLPEDNEVFRKAGNEFGSTTGRPRTCAWPDFPMMQHAIKMTHPNKIYVTKTDICPVDEIQNAVGYVLKNGQTVTEVPMSSEHIESVVYEKMPGWKFDPSDRSAIPKGLEVFLDTIRKNFPDIQIAGIGTGPARENILMFDKALV